MINFLKKMFENQSPFKNHEIFQSFFSFQFLTLIIKKGANKKKRDRYHKWCICFVSDTLAYKVKLRKRYYSKN
ncbi:hypothetical protein B9Q01_08475 [Candidatus Marsarchaeota G1 archaeon OSP_D]|uniref:Uncharacterized protein n=2 Tax=Candidatus Marsarchaeota group 1 TaxID=2203770 RepID=A0A2R6A7B0_9ARCH|nr:MAG: hypothetical protein B9Q01_08475 [Candidatus Marsarchaeota G1 archaeon OSP_D]PSN87759.1 MAG: hypothetical protein B9Q00_07845 [Candidatus Marsarchaeota G1 archaeon OSP_C]